MIGYDGNYIHVGCKVCGHVEVIPASKKTYEDVLLRRGLIQDLLPDVSPDVREMFVTGWCGCCYDLQTMFFPKLAIEELNQFIKDRFIFDGNFLTDDFSIGDNDDVIAFLQEMEYYDGVYIEEVDDALIDLRQKINELADRIDNGEFDEDDEDE